jgi:drug/metabolite transporter (DMT)-like permease
MATTIGVAGYLVTIYLCQVPITAALIVAQRTRAIPAKLTAADAGTLVAHAALAVVGVGLQLTALAFAPASYVNSVRRSSSVFSVMLGRALFGEPGLAGRLGAALLMLLGAVCLLLAR